MGKDTIRAKRDVLDREIKIAEDRVNALKEEKKSLISTNIEKLWEVHTSPNLKAVMVEAVNSGDLQDGMEVWYTRSTHRNDRRDFDCHAFLGMNIFRTKDDAIDHYVRGLSKQKLAHEAFRERELEAFIASKDGEKTVELGFPNLHPAEQQLMVEALSFYADRAHYRENRVFDSDGDAYTLTTVEQEGSDPGWQARSVLGRLRFPDFDGTKVLPDYDEVQDG